MKNNLVPTKCSFCSAEFVLSWTHREHKCICGIVYIYRPNTGRPLGREYAKRHPEKVNDL